MIRFALAVLMLLPVVTAVAASPDAPIPEYTLDVSFDLANSVIEGVARMPVSRAQEVRMDTGLLNIISVTLDGLELPVPGRMQPFSVVAARAGILEITYRGVFRGTDAKGDDESPIVSDKGIFLSGPWYPRPDLLCTYHLSARLPGGFEAVSEAEVIDKRVDGETALFKFSFPHPVDGLTLVATDRYKVVSEEYQGVTIYAYFFGEDADLIETYISRTKAYIKRYSELIGPFPYKRFSVVENFLPTGYSMPTYTLLGQQVVRLPFIPETSLGHEILHQWFGNLVYIDFAKGNWAEGLTTFLSDHLYEEDKGRGAEYRRTALAGYMSYVNKENEFSLRDFRVRQDQASEAIGYGKAAMVFQMLKTMMGSDRFFEALRHFASEMRFQRASWEDIRRAFEKVGGEDLGWFFTEWIDGKGLARLTISTPEMKFTGAAYEVSFELRQDKKGTLFVPVSLYFEGGKVAKLLRLSGERERLSLAAEGLPERLVVDEDYEVARRLSGNELTPTVARLLGEQRRLVVASSSQSDVYKPVIDFFEGRGDRVVEPNSVTHDALKADSLVILGAQNPVGLGLFGALADRHGFGISVRKNPWNGDKVVAVIESASPDETTLAFPKVTHYGKYSALSFDAGRNVGREIDAADRGIVQTVSEKPAVVDVSALLGLPAAIDRVADRRIVYVGESHDQFAHHMMELEIIRSLHKKGKKIAIGMEMFQKPFQGVLDDYVAGKIDEKALLKGTEYFKRWSFDYNLYRPILLFARTEGIPVVALNQKKEITDRVFVAGLEALSEEEKAVLPKSMDFSDDAYRERLKSIFHMHQGLHPDRFDFFYQAQVVWDETMAESIDAFLKDHPDHQMVVLAGVGHVAEGSGIPRRASRRGTGSYATIAVDADIKAGVADYVLIAPPMTGPKSPLLMVQLKESTGKLFVEGFAENSISKKAGMKVGDTILGINGAPVTTIEDLKIELLSMAKGDRAKVRVQRKGFFGVRELLVEVVFQ